MTMQISSKALAIVFAISAGSFVPVAAVAQSANPQPSAPATTQASNTIVGVAAANPDFSTLVQAVQAAGLVQTLSGPGPFTVFAPTNEAFAALPPGTLEALLEPQNRDLLTQILTYHVVSGELPSDQIRTGSVDSLNGPLNIQASSSGVTVNNATVTTPDVEASNGVIHVIDEVLVPQTTAAELGRRLEAAQTPGTNRTQTSGMTGTTSTTGTTGTTRTQTTETTETVRTQTTGTTGTTETTTTQTAQPVRGLW